MLILGIIALLAGAGVAIYGNMLNNDAEAQLKYLLETGKTNPGDMWLYIGIAVAVIGLVITIVSIIKKKK